MNIVIIERNKIFRESLKTVLDQIPDFKVVFDTDHISLEVMAGIQVNLVLLDCSLGKYKCNEATGKSISLWPAVQFLLMTNYKEECNFNSITTFDVILKNSSKKEFENKIRKMLHS